MAGLENLFAAEPTLPSVQTVKMPDNPQEWAEVVTTQVRERYPDLARIPLIVEFRKKDEQAGTAVGAVHVMDQQSNKTCYVPVIIRKFELSPMDIWMEPGTQQVHPINQDTFKRLFFAQSPVEGLEQRPTDQAGQYFNDPSTWNSNYPPLQGRYSYASAGYPILDIISDDIRQAELDRFRTALEKAAAYVLPKFHKRGHFDAISKLAARIPTNRPSFVESALKLLPVGAASVRRESKDKYSVISMADKMFDLAASEYMNEKDCRAWLSKVNPHCKDFIHDLDQEGERMLVVRPAPKNSVYLFDQTRYNPVDANQFAAYLVKTKDGIQLEGLVFPVVVDFAGRRQPVKLFISPTHASLQPSIAGELKPDSQVAGKVLQPAGARVGQTGSFVYVESGKAVATIPVVIKAIEEFGPITAVKMDGTKIRIKRGYGKDAPIACQPVGKKEKNFLDVHGMIEDRPNEYTIPSVMQWIPLDHMQDVSATPKEWMMKEAAVKTASVPTTIRWTGCVYEAAGPDFDKQAFDERHLKVLLGNKGADVDMIGQICKQARAQGCAKVYGLRQLGKKAEIIKQARAQYEALERLCAGIRRDLIKEAAEIDDAATVDAMLSLSFVNPENLTKFVSYKQVFEKVVDYLAELLLAGRLGVKDLPEATLVTSISKLQEVCEALDKIQSSLMKPTAKIAAAKPPKASKQAAAPIEALPVNPDEGSGGPEGVEEENHFANGMMDGELGQHLHMLKASRNPRDMLAYMNGKRLAEQNRMGAAMQMGMQPKDSNLKPMKQQQPASQPKGKR